MHHSAAVNLLFNLVRRDLTVRYKSTVLGFFWSFAKPLALTAIFYIVFDLILPIEFLNKGQVHSALFLLTGMLAWTFFAGACGEALHVILANANLIKKVKLPLIVFPLATVCAHLIHFLLALVVLGALLILFGLAPGPSVLLVIPVIALQFLFTLAMALLLAALNVFYRDVTSIWEVGATAWLYATPIVYPATLAFERLAALGPPWLHWAYLANPMCTIVLAYRRILLYAPLDNPALELPSDSQLVIAFVLATCVSLALFALAKRLFENYSRSFADEL